MDHSDGAAWEHNLVEMFVQYEKNSFCNALCLSHLSWPKLKHFW